MADYAHKAQTTGSVYVEKVEEYDLYCHYVAGLVGEGLSGLFAASGKEGAFMANQLELSNSMGLFLQKTNIIRDFREDVDQQRFFWPREIWGDEKYGAAVGRLAFKEMKEMYMAGNEKQAEYVQSAMILNALCHATDALDYLRLLKNQSIFNFCAIPQTMAIATLTLCFKNPEMFQRNIKIRRAEAASVCSPARSCPGAIANETHFLAYYALEKPARCRIHLPRLRAEDPLQMHARRSKFHKDRRHMWPGTSPQTLKPDRRDR